MSDPVDWKVPKWPFLLADALLMGFAYLFILRAPAAMSHWEVAALCVAAGALLGVIPFILDYKAMGKLIEVNGLGTVAEKIEGLEQFTAKITAATNQWVVIQESVGANAEKTAVSAKQIADKMGVEVREFSEFMKKMNDTEKSALRLEVDKLRRGESEWLQIIVRLMDHIFILHTAATRSNQPKIAEQITQFQNACHGTVRRIGLASFLAEAGEAFDPDRHQLLEGKQPFPGAVVAETIGAGYLFQGRVLRPALIRLRKPKEAATPATPVVAATPPASLPDPKEEAPEEAQDDLALEAD